MPPEFAGLGEPAGNPSVPLERRAALSVPLTSGGVLGAAGETLVEPDAPLDPEEAAAPEAFEPDAFASEALEPEEAVEPSSPDEPALLPASAFFPDFEPAAVSAGPVATVANLGAGAPMGAEYPGT